MGGFRGRDRRQQMQSGRDVVLEFERMLMGQVRKELVFCSWAARSMGRRVCGIALVHPEWLKKLQQQKSNSIPAPDLEFLKIILGPVVPPSS